MADTQKRLSERDHGQTLQASFNDVNSTLGVDGFIVGKVGRRIDLAIETTNVPNDTEIYTHSESGSTLYVLEIVYTDGTRDQLLSVERTA